MGAKTEESHAVITVVKAAGSVTGAICSVGEPAAETEVLLVGWLSVGAAIALVMASVRPDFGIVSLLALEEASIESLSASSLISISLLADSVLGPSPLVDACAGGNDACCFWVAVDIIFMPVFILLLLLLLLPPAFSG